MKGQQLWPRFPCLETGRQDPLCPACPKMIRRNTYRSRVQEIRNRREQRQRGGDVPPAGLWWPQAFQNSGGRQSGQVGVGVWPQVQPSTLAQRGTGPRRDVGQGSRAPGRWGTPILPGQGQSCQQSKRLVSHIPPAPRTRCSGIRVGSLGDRSSPHLAQTAGRALRGPNLWEGGSPFSPASVY